jgi:outer membrane receptor protein involved in Fe transport
MIQDPIRQINIMIGFMAIALQNTSILFNANLKPEITSSIETGIDLRMFKNRLSIDMAFYNNNSRNQILAIL